MSSTFELYERLQKVIPTERLNNIDFLKKSFDNILEISRKGADAKISHE